jgi:hypothetical protein
LIERLFIAVVGESVRIVRLRANVSTGENAGSFCSRSGRWPCRAAVWRGGQARRILTKTLKNQIDVLLCRARICVILKTIDRFDGEGQGLGQLSTV